MTKARIFNIERYAVHDGHGIRTLVFLKGCPLRCLWCANPEGQSPEPDLLYAEVDCIGCGACVEVCPQEALQLDGGGLVRDDSRCRICGLCVGECYAQALQLDSRLMSVDEVMTEVKKDMRFYRRSGGGVTLSGGEPVLQKEFAAAILKACREEFLSTAIETCGHYPWEHMAALLPWLHQVFYDVKHISPQVHERLTGRDNELILANLRRLAVSDVELVVRVPIIPGLNDEDENIAGIARMVKGLSERCSMELLPYHNLGMAKYRKLSMRYELGDVIPPDADTMERLRQRVRRSGVRCLAGA